MAVKVKVLSSEINYGEQSIYLNEVFEMHGHKCKLDIRVNAYDFQSHARAYVWQKDKLEWSLVDSVHHSKMASCKNMSYVQRNVPPSSFSTDRVALLNKLSNILA